MQEILFEGVPVKIQRRLFQRSINLLVKPSGLVKITAGKTTTLRGLTQFLEEHKDWLLNHLGKIKAEQAKYPAKEYEPGELFLFLGRHLPLELERHEAKKVKVVLSGAKITLYCRDEQKNDKEVLTKAFFKFYKNSGIEVLQKVLKEKSEIMNLYPTRTSFRAQKTRWGSCSSEGAISMNWKLIFAPPEVLEYVVIHEIAHLEHPNHSSHFWQLVKQYSPNYKTHKQWLSKNHNEIESYKF